MSSTSLKQASIATRWRRILLGAAVLGVVAVAVVVAVFATRGRPSRGVPASGPTSEPPSVTTVRPERKTLVRAIRQPGTIAAFERTPVYARDAGYVEKVHVDIGDRVRQGDVVAKLSVPELEEEVKEKGARVEQAKAEIEQAVEALAAAEAGVATAKALIAVAEAARARTQADYDRWKGEYQRVEELARRQVIDKQIRDETRNQLKASDAARDETEAKVKAAEAAHQESMAQRDKANADVKAAKARLGVAEADHRRMVVWLEYATVRAPFDGVVTARNVDPGHFLQPAAAGSGGKAEPLFVVERIAPVRIFVEVPEADAVAVRNGTPASVRIQALGSRELKGEVTRSSWSLEATERTLRTEIDLPNPEGKLRPGMYAYALIAVQHPNLLTLPATAVVKQGDQTFCYRVENGRAIRTPIKVGLAGDGHVEVLQKQTKADGDAPWEEFTGGEEIINNPAGLSDGQVVRKSTHR